MSASAVALLIMLESVSPDVAGSLLHASECIVAVCTRVQLRDQISQHPALARTHVPWGPREFVRSVELSELCLLMCPSPPCEQLPAWAQFWVDKVIPLTLRLAKRVHAVLCREGPSDSVQA